MGNICNVSLKLTRGTGSPFAAYFRKLLIEETSSIKVAAFSFSSSDTKYNYMNISCLLYKALSSLKFEDKDDGYTGKPQSISFNRYLTYSDLQDANLPVINEGDSDVILDIGYDCCINMKIYLLKGKGVMAPVDVKNLILEEINYTSDLRDFVCLACNFADVTVKANVEHSWKEDTVTFEIITKDGSSDRRLSEAIDLLYSEIEPLKDRKL